MIKLLTAILAAFGATAILFLCVIIGPFFGAVGGWVVGLVFVETTQYWLAELNLSASMWQVGALLGFVASFFRSHSSSKSS